MLSYLIIILLNLMLPYGIDGDGRYFLTPRHGSHYFMRVNTKVNILPNTAIFAYATGFRLNWNMKIPHTNGLLHHPHEPIPIPHHELQKSIEGTVDKYGLEGRACLIKAFCELVLIENYNDVISNILRVIFKMPSYVGTCPEDINCPLSLVKFAYMLYGNNSTDIL